jgi:hypothetical protein
MKMDLTFLPLAVEGGTSILISKWQKYIIIIFQLFPRKTPSLQML